MSAHKAILDIDALSSNLELSVDYASQAGLLSDRNTLDLLKSAEKSLERDGTPDIDVIAAALNEVTRRIQPLTLADLRFGRNPVSPENQGKSHWFQLCLTLFSLMTLVVIGYFMNYLSAEQDALQELARIQEMQPQLKLTALRKMAQYDEPMRNQSPLYDDFHHRIVELREINNKISVAYLNVLRASKQPLLPFVDSVSHFMTSLAAQDSTGVPGEHASEAASRSPPTSGAETGKVGSVTGSKQIQLVDYKFETSVTSANSAPAEENGSCGEDDSGHIKTPSTASGYPKWMRNVLSDTLGDYCFQVKVLSPDGGGQLLSPAMAELDLASKSIKEKIAMRVFWLAPFLFGLLGASMYLMRNVANIRTPAMEWLAIAMRISLGGIAGIVVGWFSISAASKNIEGVTSLSVPFILAFLTGYGIDALFSLLDKLNQMIGKSAHD